MKCNDCLNVISIISENGLHPICSLSDKNAIDCIMEKKDYKVTINSIKEKEDDK